MGIRQLKGQSLGGFPFIVISMVVLFFAYNARADVMEYQCPGGLPMPPAVKWAKVLIIPDEAFHTQGMALTSAEDGTGTFLVSGSAWADSGGDEYGLVVKMNQEGGIVDSATFFDILQQNGLYTIQPTYSASHVMEGYIAAGYKEALHKAPGDDNWWHEPDAWLLKLNLSLDMVWQVSFGMQGEDWANTVIQNDAGYLFGGALRDIGAPPWAGWVFQTDETGSGLWSKSMYYYCSREDEKDNVVTDPCPAPNIESNLDPEAAAIIYSLLPTADGGSVAGYRSSMRKLDAVGNQVWLSDGGGAVIESGNGFLGAGIEESGDTSAMKLTRVTSGGEVVWSTLYGEDAATPSDFPSTEFRSGYGLVEAADGGYLFAGVMDFFGTGSRSLWLVKTRPATEGDVAWALPIDGMALHSTRPLMATDDGGVIVTGSTYCFGETHLLTVKVGTSGLQAPQASFTMSPEGPYFVGQTITFDGSASFDPDGDITAYHWDFGDGTAGAGATAHHSYSGAGDYTVTFTVMDDDGMPMVARQTLSVAAPGLLWERTITSRECEYDCFKVQAQDIIKTWDESYVIAGHVVCTGSSGGAGAAQSWLFEIYENGILKWEQHYAPEYGRDEKGFAVARIQEERGYILTGQGNRRYNGFEEDLLLIETNQYGTARWVRRLGNDGVYTAGGRDVLVRDDGGYLTGGWKRAEGDFSMWLFKADQDGIEVPGQSAVFHPYSNRNPVCNVVIPTSDEGYLISGECCNGDMSIIKTDDDLNEDWDTTFQSGAWSASRGYWAAEVDGGYVVAGTHNNRLALFKVNQSGEEDWITVFPRLPGGSIYQRDAALAGAVTPDGGTVLAGYKSDDTVYHYRTLYLIKTDADGVLEWEQSVQEDNVSLWATGVIAEDDGSYVVIANRKEGNLQRVKIYKFASYTVPVAAFEADVTSGSVPLTVTFNNLSSGGSAPRSHSWDLDGDGQFDDSAEEHPQYTYPLRGTYTVSLLVTDSVGRTNTFTRTNYIGADWDTRYRADLNGDGDVDGSDLAELIEAFGSSPDDPNWNPLADLDGNGTVGVEDLTLFAEEFGSM